MGIFLGIDMDIKITAEVLNLISEIDEFKGKWTSLKNIRSSRLSALKKISTIESIGSSTRIEGSKLSDIEIDNLLSNIDIKQFKSRDEEEVAGYSEAMNTIFESYKSIELKENYIKQLHSILLKFSKKDDHHKGKYKNITNTVEMFNEKGESIGVIFKTATPFETPLLMSNLINATNGMIEKNKYHPLLIISYFIIHFLAIHPFEDGNGRLSRILTNLMLLKFNYFYIQYNSLESIIEINKENYYQALRKSQKNIRTDKENINSWIIFFLNCLKQQKDLLMNKIEKEIKMVSLPESSEIILRIISEHGRISNRQIVSITGMNRNTVKANLKKLTDLNYIDKKGQRKGSYYIQK